MKSEDVNRVVLRGRVGKKPVLRYMPSGDAVCSFALVTSFGDHDEWHKLVGYYENAEYAVREFDQGDTVYFEGYIRTREYQTEEDKRVGRTAKRAVLELVAETWVLVRKSKRGQEGAAVLPDQQLASDSSSRNPVDESANGSKPKALSYL